MSKPRFSDDDVQTSFCWFANQPQSAVFISALRAIVDEIGPSETCALHAHNERRKFAADLLAMAETDRRDGPDQGTTDDLERKHDPRITTRKSRRAGPAGRG